jgi:excisionase family DNA binding protein
MAKGAGQQGLGVRGESVPRPALATVKEAEDYLKLSRVTIYGLMQSGELQFVKIGKSRRIPWDALDELVRRHTVGA